MNHSAQHSTLIQFPRPAGQASSPNGNCASCGVPILFMNVMLCTACLEQRLAQPHQSAASL